VVVHRVENRLVVRRPGERRDLLHGLGEELPRGEVLDVQAVFPEADVVRRIGEEAPVVGDLLVRDRHELLAPGELVDVEDDLLGVSFRLLAAVDRILLPLLGPGVVEVLPLAVGNREVRLLDPGQHLVVELLLEFLGRLHDGVGVGVFLFEVCPDLRVCPVSEPEVVVGERLAVQVRDLLDLLCHRWLRDLRDIGRNGRRDAAREGGHQDPTLHVRVLSEAARG
jgi:hypothetical protein